MANTDTALFTAQNNPQTLHGDGTLTNAQMPLCLGEFEFTLDGTETTAHDFRLLRAPADCYVRPEDCRLATEDTLDTDATFVLEKVATDGTVTALTGACSVDTVSGTPTQGAPFARLVGSPVLVSEGETIQLTITDDTVISASEVLRIELVTYSPNHN